MREFLGRLTLTRTLLQIMGVKSSGLDVVMSNGSSSPRSKSKFSRIKLTPAERKRLQERIKKAESLQEIMRLA